MKRNVFRCYPSHPFSAAKILYPDEKQLKEEGVCLPDCFRVQESTMWGRHSNRQEQELAGDVVVHTQEEEGIGKGLAKNPRCPRVATHALQPQLQTSTNSPTRWRPSVPHTYSNNTFIESSGSLSHYLLFCKVGKLKDPGN